MTSTLPEFSAFRASWLEPIVAGSPSTVQLGQRFSQKLIADWLDTDESQLDIVYCDGSGDGGIDAALLDVSAPVTDDDSESGDTWYLIQSKYGSAFAGVQTLLIEGQKVIDTVDGRRGNLSSLATGLLERVQNFKLRASARDRIVLVFATVDALSPDERRAMGDLRAMGRERIGTNFDVMSVALHTIYERLAEEAERTAIRRLSVPLRGHLVEAGDGLLVGSVSVVDLYTFLKTYRDATDDLDQLFEKMFAGFLAGE